MTPAPLTPFLEGIPMTMTDTRSAYPTPIEDLMPQARAYAASLGYIPSRNKLMAHLHIGPDKAKLILPRLADESSDIPVSPAGPVADMDWPPTRPVAPESPQVAHATSPDTSITPTPPLGTPIEADIIRSHRKREEKRPRSWPLFLLALPAFVAVWSGWVGLGTMAGFGIVHPFPGIADHVQLNTAITLPVGVEAYAAYAIRVWLSRLVSGTARTFAKWSTIGALILGVGGQIAYHLMTAWHMTAAPWPILAVVASLPVIVMGAGTTLAHLVSKES